MKDHDLYKWEVTRKKGLLRYVIKYGPLIALALFANDILWKALSQQTNHLNLLSVGLISLLGGLLLAPLFWLSYQYRYQRWQDTLKENS